MKAYQPGLFDVEAKRVSRVYHNTTDKNGQDLDKAQTKASKQTEVILKMFRDRPHSALTPWDVHFHLGQQIMITSVRRAITTLTDAGYLEKTGERRRSGPANETNFVWKLKPKSHEHTHRNLQTLREEGGRSLWF